MSIRIDLETAREMGFSLSRPITLTGEATAEQEKVRQFVAALSLVETTKREFKEKQLSSDPKIILDPTYAASLKAYQVAVEKLGKISVETGLEAEYA